MLVIVNNRIPDEAKLKLAGYGELLEFSTSGITYDAISGHPDIFFCQSPWRLIVAPNTPVEFLEKLDAQNISYTPGEKPVGSKYPETALYNAVVTSNYLFHNTSVTDVSIVKSTLSFNPACLTQAYAGQAGFSPLSFPQGYTRCNLIALNEGHFITSDRGIEKALKAHHLDVLYVSPAGIVLPGFPNGFFGGCCGVWDDKLFIIGSLRFFPEGENVRQYANESSLEVIELFDGPLYDGGGILFINS
jgi:hypothetical protein